MIHHETVNLLQRKVGRTSTYLIRRSYLIFFSRGFKPSNGLDLASLDETIRFYCNHSIADTPRRTYQSSMRKFYKSCVIYDIPTPLPVTESILCYYALYLGSQNLTPQTIKTYLAANHAGSARTKEVLISAATSADTEWYQKSARREDANSDEAETANKTVPYAKDSTHWSKKGHCMETKMFWAAANLHF